MLNQKTIQYSVPVKNEPAALHKLLQVIAKERINLTAVRTEDCRDLAIFRFLTDAERSRVRRPLEAAGYQVCELPCLQVELRNEPGELARMTKVLADGDIAIHWLYATTGTQGNTRIAAVVDEAEKAHELLARMMEKVAA